MKFASLAAVIVALLFVSGINAEDKKPTAAEPPAVCKDGQCNTVTTTTTRVVQNGKVIQSSKTTSNQAASTQCADGKCTVAGSACANGQCATVGACGSSSCTSSSYSSVSRSGKYAVTRERVSIFRRGSRRGGGCSSCGG